MEQNFSDRPVKDVYYLGIARQIGRRSTCLRSRFGAIIVKDDVVVSTGYKGAPRGTPNCHDLKKCIREKLNVPSGQRYEVCRGVHAETNAILNAARSGINIIDGILYLFGETPDGIITEPKPCSICRRHIINAGLSEVVVPWKNGVKRYLVKNWVKESIRNPFKELKEDEY